MPTPHVILQKAHYPNSRNWAWPLRLMETLRRCEGLVLARVARVYKLQNNCSPHSYRCNNNTISQPAHFNQNRRSLSPKVTTQSLFQTSQLRFKFARLFCWHALKTSLPCCSQECIALYSKSSLWLECKTVLNSDKLSRKKKARSSKLVHNDCLHLWKQRRRQTSANEGVL